MKNDLVKTTINVKDTSVGVMRVGDTDYISLTDLARYADKEEPRLPIRDWMRNKEVISFLGLWESINNQNFKRGEFAPFENEASSNKFKMSPRERLVILNETAKNQLKLLINNKSIKEIEKLA